MSKESPFEIYWFDGKKWSRHGESADFDDACDIARRLTASRGSGKAADVSQDGVKLASFREGKRR